LLAAVRDFELVVESSEKFCDSSRRLSRILSQFFAMRAAFSIRAAVALWAGNLHKGAADAPSGRWDCPEPGGLPTIDIVRRATRQLSAAVASNHGVGVVDALEDMGVLALCPVLGEHLSRMERLAGNVSGRARLVFLVELSLLAVRLGHFDAASRYVSEAWSLDPSEWELYNLYVLEGLFALNAGRIRVAIQCLNESIDACQVDEHDSLNCGVRAPNFTLAEKLLEHGEQVEVLRYLLQCKNVWQSPRMQIGKWVELIESGATPAFQECEVIKLMNMSSYMLDKQWMRTRSLESSKGPSIAVPSRRSPEEVVAARKRLMRDCEDYISARVMERIRYLEEPGQGET